MAIPIRYTKKGLEKLPPAAPGKRDYYEDARYPGLRLSVTDKGTKSWVLQRRVDGRVRRFTLGNFPAVSIENARKRYDRKQGEIADGKHEDRQQQAKVARRVTLETVFEQFLEARTLKPSTVKSYRQVMNAALGDWLKQPLSDLTKQKVGERHAKLTRNNGAAYADSAMRTLSSVWNYAEGRYEDVEGESLLPPNPVKRLSKTRTWNRPKARTSYIREHQLKPWFSAVEELRHEPWGTMGQTAGDYLTLLILTGMRATEAASLPWSQVDLEDRALRVTDTKNHQELHLPLSDYLCEVLTARRYNLEGDYVFPGSGTGKHPYIIETRNHMRRVIKASGVEFRKHDLRRTFTTSAERLGLPPYALSRLINHKFGHPMTRQYIIMDLDRLRGPMQEVTDYMLKTAGLR